MFVRNYSEIFGNMAQHLLTPISCVVHYDCFAIHVEGTSPYSNKFNEIIRRISRLVHIGFDSKGKYQSLSSNDSHSCSKQCASIGVVTQQSNFSPLCQPKRSLPRVRVKARPTFSSSNTQTLANDFFLLNSSNRIEALLHGR